MADLNFKSDILKSLFQKVERNEKDWDKEDSFFRKIAIWEVLQKKCSDFQFEKQEKYSINFTEEEIQSEILKIAEIQIHNIISARKELKAIENELDSVK